MLLPRSPLSVALLLLLALAPRPVHSTAPPAGAARSLLEAVRTGTADQVAALLGAGADPDSQRKFRVSALMLAAERGEADVVGHLLGAGATVDLRNSWGETALHYAAREGRQEVVRRLLAAGADPGPRAKLRRSPLYLAADGGHAAVVSLLLAAGADPGAQVAEGETPLHAAARGGHLEAVEALLGAGAPLEVRDRSGLDAYGSAVAAGSLGTADRLASALRERGLPVASSPLRPPVEDVSDIDWEGRAYALGGCTAELRLGRTRESVGPCAVTATEVFLGDLTGDPAREAVVVLHRAAVSERARSVLFLFGVREGTAVELDRLPRDSGSWGAIERVRLDDRSLELTREGDGGHAFVEVWRWHAASARLEISTP